jgi:hypothetical protein
LKFVARRKRRNSDKKNKLSEPCDSEASFCFSGISETTQANFKRALIFCLLFYQEKSNSPDVSLAAA